MSEMQRYTVTVVPHIGPEVQLIIPASPQTTVEGFRKIVIARASKRSISLPDDESTVVRLLSIDGPLLDSDDSLVDVILAPASEQIFLVHPQHQARTTTSLPTVTVSTAADQYDEGFEEVNVFHEALEAPHRENPGIESNTGTEIPSTAQLSTQSERPTVARSICYGIRVVTPELAQKFKSQADIPLLKNGKVYSGNMLLREVIRDVSELMEVGLSANDEAVIDIHTSEVFVGPGNVDVTLEHLRLKDLVIGGVLNLYALRRPTSRLRSLIRPPGQDDMFGRAQYWNPPERQSKRGEAAFLSSLRVFGHLISARKMEEDQQQEILRVVHDLFRFPPALSAFRKLIDGKTLRPWDSAAIAQACHQALLGFIPRPLIRGDTSRVFEGARLLFGVILDRARQVKGGDSGSKRFIHAYRTIDLKDCTNGNLVKEPIMTELGLMNKSTFDNLPSPPEIQELDPCHRRIILLTTTGEAEISYFDHDLLPTLLQHSGSTKDQIGSELDYLAALCEQNNLSVTSPSSLPHATAPSLTLDIEGLPAVYTGRVPCGEAGRDHQIFRPADRLEEAVDVALVEQAIQATLKRREADGTAVFDLFGKGSRRISERPDELIVFCVDISRSMEEFCDFEELKETNRISLSPDSADTYLESDASVLSLPELQKFLRDHESWEDMLAILHKVSDKRRKTTAALILESLILFLSREMDRLASSMKNASEFMGRRRVRDYQESSRGRLSHLYSTIEGLKTHYHALKDYLLFSASQSTNRGTNWTWSPGQLIPSTEESSAPAPAAPALPDFSDPPPELVCPIGHEIFDDPVTACDGHTYERRSIERWFQIRHTSPLTGLTISDTSLKFNAEVRQNARRWIEAEDLLDPTGRLHSSASIRRKLNPTKDGNEYITLHFTSSVGIFSRKIPLSMSLATLYTVVFRGMRGLRPSFALSYTGGETFDPEPSRQVRSAGFRPMSTVFVKHRETESSDGSVDKESTEMVLVKLYDRSREFLFAYWTPRDKIQTFDSVIFKRWRFLCENQTNGVLHIEDIEDVMIWSNMMSTGDGYGTGWPKDGWRELNDLFTSSSANGCLETEGVFETSVPDNHLTGETDQPLVVKLQLHDYQTSEQIERRRRERERRLSRLDVCKQTFGAFVNRTLAYNYATHLGIVTFGTDVKVKQSISGVVEDFRHSMIKMKAAGDTALWDALDTSLNIIDDHSVRFPEAKRRIICLSDGEDTKSKITDFHMVMERARESRVVIDSLCIGKQDKSKLMWVSQSTGGYKFAPKTLEQAMAIFEMEPVLNQLERPPIVLSPAPSYWGQRRIEPDMVTRDSVPPRKAHPNQNDVFISIASAGSTKGASQPTSNVRSKRLLEEIKNIAANPHPHYDVYISDSDMSFWKVVMVGPPGSAYATGTFVLYLDMGEKYPAFPPHGRFITPIYHPNVNRHGRICHSIFDRNWMTDTSNLQVLNCVYSLLLVPEFDQPVNTVVTFDYHWDEVQFQDEVKEHIKKHATKTRDTHRGELLGVPESNETEAEWEDVGAAA